MSAQPRAKSLKNPRKAGAGLPQYRTGALTRAQSRRPRKDTTEPKIRRLDVGASGITLAPDTIWILSPLIISPFTRPGERLTLAKGAKIIPFSTAVLPPPEKATAVVPV